MARPKIQRGFSNLIIDPGPSGIGKAMKAAADEAEDAAKKALETEAQKAAEATDKKRLVEVENPLASAPKITSDRNKKVLNGTQQYPTVLNGTQQYPTVLKKTHDASLTVPNGTQLTVPNGTQKSWRHVFCLALKFFNDTQQDNVPKCTSNNAISAATGLAHQTVKNALNALTAQGYLENLGGKSGRWRPEVRRRITPLGYALMASDYFKNAVEQNNRLTVPNGTQRYPVNGTQRYPMTDRQTESINKSVNLSEAWLNAAKSGLIPGLTPEALHADLLALKPDRWTPDEFLEQAKIWAHRKRVDKAWYGRIKKSEWKTFAAEMLERGGIDPRPGYRPKDLDKALPAAPVQEEPYEEARDPQAQQVRLDFQTFALTSEGEVFVKSCKERGLDPFTEWNMQQLRAILGKKPKIQL